MSLARTAARVVLGSLMVGAGVSHSTVSRDEFRQPSPRHGRVVAGGFLARSRRGRE